MATTKTTTTTYSQSGYADPTYVDFNSDAWKKAYIDSMVSELQKNYDIDKSALDKSYNTSITNYNNQIADTNMSYDSNIQGLQKQRYQDYQEAKNSSFARGLGNGGLGAAIEQTAINNANNKIAETQNERTKAINDINTLINQATYNYNIDSDTLLKNFNSDKLQYMSTAELQALEKRLEVDMYNNNWTNQFAQDSNNRYFTSTESQKQRDWEAQQKALDRAANAALASSYSSGGYSSGSPRSGLTLEQQDNLLKNYMEENNIPQTKKLVNMHYSFLKGDISFDDIWNYVVGLANTGSGTGRGGSANKNAGAGRRTSTASSKNQNNLLSMMKNLWFQR